MSETKDGDWGVDMPEEGHTRHYVIRGADFPSVRLGKLQSIPSRFLPDKTVWRRVLQANDILLETAGGTRDRPTGRSLLIKSETLNGLDAPVIGASFTRFLRADGALVHPRYLYWYLQYLYSIGRMYEYQVQHTGIARFQYTVFANAEEIPTPSPEQQRAIADVLGALDDKIAANERMAEAARQLALARFVGSLNNGTTISVSAAASMLIRGVTPNYVEGPGMTVLNQKCVRNQRVSLEQARLMAPLSNRLDRILQKNDVLVNSTGVGTLGRAARWTRESEATVDSHITIVRFNEAVADPVCAGFALLRLENEIEALAEGSTGQTELRRELLGSLILEVPTWSEQVRLGRELDELDAVERSKLEESKKLARTRDELLPLLMSGKLRVKDAEAVASGVL
ncbi:restriction endonuclease subunit S [Mycobacterium conspicuum]|uniref:restriction endonuclease subunit S n=1 Tax=Mycobacterium conspicuum TaxID=44010 RepID=UPI000A154CE2|nr:restriction endonuclease subunit S [Mycobacterium conspicuum]ORV33917.1 hypothetical protein AWC00_26490 [Mycobacterium conspicuum]